MSSADSFEPAAPPRPQKRGWWSRNWMWATPVGCLTPLVLCGGCVFAVIGGVFGALKASDPYQKSLAAVRADAEVQEALGAPIEPGWLVQGNLNVTNGASSADLNYPVSGPNGSGTVYVVGEAEGDGLWVYREMRIRIDGGPEIDLLPPGAADAPAENLSEEPMQAIEEPADEIEEAEAP
ncbi:cytochrome c oxidase assembly factor 1 family protein [Alienimonas sp. DA493]|uniref:cytochrome c oxidase assembly factor 1 family protein n=1 Tax=Alienimonas sp. DA493 TaxID=3373605 RepID=UPI00375406C7